MRIVSAPTSVLAWHFVGATLRDGRPVRPDGEELTHSGPLEMCKSGLHASKRILDALQYAPGDTVCRVRCAGEIVCDTDKLVCRSRTVLWRVDAAAQLREFARACAMDVAHLWTPPPLVLDYLRTGDEATRAAAEAAAWGAANAAEDAPWTAAEDAPWAAAGDAPWAAAGDAALAAAWAAANAARAAANAARDAANAAWDAAWAAAWAADWAAAWAADWAAANAARDAARAAARAAARDAVRAAARERQNARLEALIFAAAGRSAGDGA